MPKVPTYDQFTVQPSDAAQPRFSAPDMPLVAGKEALAISDGMIKAGTALTAVAEKAAQEADQVRVIDATNDAVKAQLHLTYDKNDGFLNLKGKTALERPDGKPLDIEYTERLQSQLEAIENKLGNDRQKALFKQAAGSITRQFMGSINSHVAQEYKDYTVGTLNGSIDVATQKMTLNFGDPKIVAEQQRLIGAAVEERDKSLPPEQRQANLVKALSPGNTAIVSAAIDAGNVEYAKEFLKQNAQYITPENRLVLAKAVEMGAFDERVQKFADDIWDESNGDLQVALKLVRERHSGKDETRTIEEIKTRYTESKVVDSKKLQTETDRLLNLSKGDVPTALKMAREEFDSEFEDALVKSIRDRDVEATAVRQREQKQAREEAFGFFNQKGFGSIPKAVLARMDPEDVDRMRQLQESRNYSRTLQGEANERRRQQKLYKEAAPEFLTLYSDIDKLEQMTPAEILLLEPKFGEQHVRTLLDRNQTLQNAEGRRTAKIDDDQFKSIANEYGLNPYNSRPSVKQKETLGLVQSRVDLMLEQAAKQKRQPLTKDEKAKIMRDAMKETVEIDGMIWNDTKPALTVTPDEEARVIIPAADRTGIVAALKERYRKNPVPENEPTEANIRSLYLLGKGVRK